MWWGQSSKLLVRGPWGVCVSERPVPCSGLCVVWGVSECPAPCSGAMWGGSECPAPSLRATEGGLGAPSLLFRVFCHSHRKAEGLSGTAIYGKGLKPLFPKGHGSSPPWGASLWKTLPCGLRDPALLNEHVGPGVPSFSQLGQRGRGAGGRTVLGVPWAGTQPSPDSGTGLEQGWLWHH